MTQYERIAGNLDVSGTFTKLTDLLRQAEECCYMLGHHRKMENDDSIGNAWLKVGEQLDKMNHLVVRIATGRH